LGQVEVSRQFIHKSQRRFRLHLFSPALLRSSSGSSWVPPPAPSQQGRRTAVNDFCAPTIDPDTLVKKLDLDSRSIISSRTGLEEKPVLSKKEKMKLRKERWLQKIESVKLAKQKQKAEAKRKATPVVGDMQPLMEALPELCDLTTGGRGRKPPKRYVPFRDGLSDFCLMKQAQKHRLLEEEVTRFHEVITNPRYRANPLMAISEHLSKRLRQEEEGKPL
uniref:Family with sequence similarity 207 member A n=1 Tax=Falco tinnunculus TaxID=100819 RepID=A0A8C4XN79_FALTI